MLPHFHWRTTVPHRAIHLRFVACSAESAIESAAAASLIKLQLRKRFPPATRKLHFSIPRNLFAIWMSRQMTGKIAMRMIWPNEIWFEGVKLSAAKGRFTTCFLLSLYTITHTRAHTHVFCGRRPWKIYTQCGMKMPNFVSRTGRTGIYRVLHTYCLPTELGFLNENNSRI